MTWIITTDHLSESEEFVHVVGQGQWGTPGVESDPPETDGPGWRTFRLCDDDGILYYSGRFDEAAELNDMDWGGLFQAYQWGMADSGTTDLLVEHEDGWESVYG